jgi:hypothetical protein
MATNKYITISDYVPSSGSPAYSKRFPVVQGGYKPIKDKKINFQETIRGGLDVGVGSIYETYQYVIRVRAEEESPFELGTLSDLDYFYSLNNPAPTSGSPSNIIVLTDHYGLPHYGYFDGQFVPEPVTTIIEGIYAWFMVPIQLRLIPEDQEPTL